MRVFLTYVVPLETEDNAYLELPRDLSEKEALMIMKVISALPFNRPEGHNKEKTMTEEKNGPTAEETTTEEQTATAEGGQENTQTVSEGEGTQDAIAE